MSDKFGAIASNEIGFSREPLVFPEPVKVTSPLIQMSEYRGDALKVYKKPDTKKEIDGIIDDLTNRYAPFLTDISPYIPSYNKIIPLDAFDFRLSTEEDCRDFSIPISGRGEWEKIGIPHYDGPVGDAVSFYRTEFYMPRIGEDKAVFIRFEGVDYIAEVFVNGNYAGSHEGFFSAFEFDITKFLREGINTLLVRVKNDYPYNGAASQDESMSCEGDKMYAATGPGYDDPQRGWHHCPPGMGIFQGVTVEIRNRVFISDLYVRPMPESSEYEIWCEVYSADYAPVKDIKLSFSVYGFNFTATLIENAEFVPFTYTNGIDGDCIEYDKIETSDREKSPLSVMKGENLFRVRFKCDSFKYWSPDEPYLYSARASLIIGGNTVDYKAVNFGMRSFRIDTESTPKGMMYLNGKSIRLRGANTMGFEQQDVICGNMGMLLYDMLMAKACNMNFLRLTQRPVQKEIYDLCDKLGLMLQSDLPLFTNMRRTKFALGVKLAEEMEKLLRTHPSNILISYMNEPMMNAGNRPHRHLIRREMQDFFSACDMAVRLYNPDRAIKHIDGDYDPPDTTLPDNHCYCMWYNGHGIDAGKLNRGYWIGVKKDWYYGCGEYGSEGLDTVSLMKKRYPAEWLPKTPDEEKDWTPKSIKNAQTGNMHYFHFDTQHSLEDWVRESRRHQVKGTRLQTSAFRRDKNMVTFAIHLFTDAWPSGWMKTIVDCERVPKPAFYEYRDLLTPLMVNLRADRRAFFSGETASMEAYICNDTHTVSDGHKLVFELLDGDKVLARADTPAEFGENSSFPQGLVTFTAPEVKGRVNYILRMCLTDKNGTVLHYTDEEITVFENISKPDGDAVFVTGEKYLASKEIYDSLAYNGATVIVEDLDEGEYDIAGGHVKIRKCGMRPLHFVSRDTGHPLVNGFEQFDFSMWYDDKEDMITPLLYKTFVSEGFTPILTSGNCEKGSAWQYPLFCVNAAAERNTGKGKIIVSELVLNGHMKNPAAAIFRNRLSDY